MKKRPYVILAAGAGTRMHPLTDTTPKPLLSVFGKPLISHTLTQAAPFVSEIIIITGYLNNQFPELLGDSFDGIPISYITQDSQNGTAHALQQVAELGLDSFFCSYGDDWYHHDCFAALADHDAGIVTTQSERWRDFGVVVTDQQNRLCDFVEKPETFVSDLVNTGLYLFPGDIFSMYSRLKPSPRGEMEIPEMIRMHAAKKHYQVIRTAAQNWLAIGYPWDLIRFIEHYGSQITSNHAGTIEEGVTINGTVVLGEGAIIKAGTYIEGTVVIGSGAQIGPNAFLRGTLSIGSNSKIGAGCEVKNSVIGSHTHIPHLSYIGDSVIGNHVNIGAGSITANLRHDSAIVKTMVKESLVSTGRSKFGVIIGDGAKLGINTTLYPGRKIGTHATTEPGSVVTKDVS